MSTTGHESEAINVQGLKASLKKGGNIGIYNEAICSTAGGTAAKVTNTTPPSFTLTAGAKILVKFTYSISAENATLQVGSSTAKPIYYKGAALPADIVKAGTSVLLQYDGTSYNIVGDLNTDTTYSTMGASGSSHSGGLVPDTPSTAGITKFLREDGTWTEPMSAGNGIDITNNEISADNTIARKTDLTPAKLGNGIGTCSTSSGTALTVSLTGYELVQNGFVAVSFTNDVPASSTLNINSKGAKPIYYKGSAIEADTIKADDTVMFCYNGSQYVVTSLGGGGAAPVNPNETVNISLTQIGGNNADLIGATVTITDDNSGSTIFTGLYSGTVMTTEISVGTFYTISVEPLSGYMTCSDKHGVAGYQTEKSYTFQYRGYGAFIEATDGTLYTSTQWASAEKTANAVVCIASAHHFRIALENTVNKAIDSTYVPLATSYCTTISNKASAKVDYDGAGNTQRLINYNTYRGTNTTTYAAPYCAAYTFPDGVTKGYLPAGGEVTLIVGNLTQIDACLTACGKNGVFTGAAENGTHIWSSTYTPRPGETDKNACWFWKTTENDLTAQGTFPDVLGVRICGAYN